MNLDDFSYEENGRRYINPQVPLDEENAFIQNLRDTTQRDNQKIYRDTHNLGTDVPSNIGGLNGGEAYWNARYQTPQLNNTIASLRATAQAQALSQAMTNELNKAKKRYSDAYKKASGGGGGGNGGKGDVDYKTDEGDTYDFNGRTKDGLKVDEEASKPSILNPQGKTVVSGQSAKVWNPFEWVSDLLSGREGNRQAWKKYAKEHNLNYNDNGEYYFLYDDNGKQVAKGRL